MKRWLARLPKRGYRFLSRLDWSAVLLFAILVWVAIGTWFPQRSPELRTDPGRLAFWEAEIRARYGDFAGILERLGAFQWYRSPLFKGGVGWLALATLACTLHRWRGVWRRAFRRPTRTASVAPYRASLTLPEGAWSLDALREILCRHGFRAHTVADREGTWVYGARHRLTPLATLLTHLATLLLLVGVGLSSAYGWREELRLRPGTVETLDHGAQGIAYRQDGFEILHRPDGSILDYAAEIAILQQGVEVKRGTVRVNAPLYYQGQRVYLRGYVGRGERYIVTLWVTRDPGYPLIVVGGFLLIGGMTLTFNFPRSWVHARVTGETLAIAGRAEGSARWKAGSGFGGMFAALVAAVGERASVRRPSANDEEGGPSANDEAGGPSADGASVRRPSANDEEGRPLASDKKEERGSAR